MLLLVIAYLAQFIYLDDDVAGRLHALFALMPPSIYFLLVEDSCFCFLWFRDVIQIPTG